MGFDALGKGQTLRILMPGTLESDGGFTMTYKNMSILNDAPTQDLDLVPDSCRYLSGRWGQ